VTPSDVTSAVSNQKSAFARAVLLGICAALFVLCWQSLTVHYNYGGNWTALFCIRASMPVPAFLKSENLYLFHNSEGYDGQVYHLIAHDPWMRKGSADAIVDVSFRYQRILVPALAWIFALGHDPWIHASYFFVILAFVFLGVYWTAQFAVRADRSPAWGLLFLLAPATIVSIDRMTVDIALAAFACGFAYYVSDPASKNPHWKILAILVCAALTRETAVLIIAGYATYLATRRRLLHALIAAATAIPAAAWYLYLSSLKRSSAPDYVAWIPFAGFAQRILRPAHYSLAPLKAAVAMTGDYLALAGIALLFACAIALAIRRRWNAPSAAIYALAIAAALIGSRSVWEEAYAFARVLTPLLLLVAFQFLRTRPGLAFALLLFPDAPIALALWRQIDGVLRGIAGP
jgi:hypothetical protein